MPEGSGPEVDMREIGPTVPTGPTCRKDHMTTIEELIARVADDVLRAELERAVGDLRGSAREPDEPDARTQREYRLAYAGKRPEAEILLETAALPFQRIRTFGDLDDDTWHNMLIGGDNLPVLRRLIDMKGEGRLRNADGSDGVRQVFIDPPFASAENYETGSGTIAYSDKIKGAEFIESLRKRLILIREVLADDASIFVHLDWRKVHYIKAVMDEVFGEHNLVNEIVWHYRTYQGHVSRNFPRKHDTILFYGRGAYPFRLGKDGNLEGTIDFHRWGAFLTPDNEIRGDNYPTTDSRFAPLLRKWIRENGGRAPGPDDVLYRIEGNTIDTVWDIKAVDPKSKDRLGYPTQKPEELLTRIISAASDAGDIVLDCFVGSGTTLAVAEKLGRRWIGVDMGLGAIYTTQKRLISIAASDSLTETRTQTRKLKPCCGERACVHCQESCCRPVTTETPLPYGHGPLPFGVYSAGHYDFWRLRALPFADYRTFVLRLFGATEGAETINGLAIDGRHRGDPALVLDFTAAPDAMVTIDFFTDLAGVLGRRTGGRVLFIAPAASLAFLEDEVVAGEVRFEIRRVPYSVVAALRRRGSQPSSEADINRMIETEGFDFSVPPAVECHLDPAARTLAITRFRSRAIARDLTEAKRGFSALAMVLVDYAYDGRVFDLDAVIFADELEASGRQVSLARAQAGEAVAVSICDIFGNEHIEVFRDQPWGAT